jgi:hypothetical protein
MWINFQKIYAGTFSDEIKGAQSVNSGKKMLQTNAINSGL